MQSALKFVVKVVVTVVARTILPAPVVQVMQVVAKPVAKAITQVVAKKSVSTPTTTQRSAAASVFQQVSSRPYTPSASGSSGPTTYSAWPGYVNLGVSAGIPVPAGPVVLPFGVGTGTFASSAGVYPYYAVGASTRGPGFNLTYSLGDPSPGCAWNFAASYWIGASIDTSGNIEVGIMSPGMSALYTCTREPVGN